VASTTAAPSDRIEEQDGDVTYIRTDKGLPPVAVIDRSPITVRHRIIFAIIALLGVIGWMSYMLWGPKEGAPAFQRADSLPPAAAVEDYIKGQQSYDANMMWDAYSTDYQASQLANGASKATLQARANSERTMGLKYVHYDYIGGVKVDNGSMYFYSVDLALQSQRGRFPIIFRADADGKIVGIDSPLSRIASGGGQ